MKIMILGANGMLGHCLLRSLSEHGHEMIGTLRRAPETVSVTIGNNVARLIGGISVEQEGIVEHILDSERPDVVVNCVGVVKQLSAAKDPLVSIPINAMFPHRLALSCAERGMRMIHFSTDCVFSGTAGPYSEASRPDPQDIYGLTKLLGEVNTPNALTIRTSIIGHELDKEGPGLVSWIIRSRGTRVSGFARALYTGVTTDFMADAVHRLITDFPELCGVWHLSADAISKYDLVCLMNEIYGLGMTIDRDETFVCDRRLDSALFRRRTGIVPPPWRDMLMQMHANHLEFTRK